VRRKARIGVLAIDAHKVRPVKPPFLGPVISRELVDV
jgi:hypothetical protein